MMTATKAKNSVRRTCLVQALISGLSLAAVLAVLWEAYRFLESKSYLGETIDRLVKLCIWFLAVVGVLICLIHWGELLAAYLRSDESVHSRRARRAREAAEEAEKLAAEDASAAERPQSPEIVDDTQYWVPSGSEKK